jgi:hypothetical protein
MVELIRIDPITCVKHHDYKTFCFYKLIAKDQYLFGYIYIFIYLFIYFVTEFQNHGNEHDHGLLWIKMHLCMECTQMKKLNSL